MVKLRIAEVSRKCVSLSASLVFAALFHTVLISTGALDAAWASGSAGQLISSAPGVVATQKAQAPAVASLMEASASTIKDRVYTGKAHKPKPTLKCSGKRLKLG